MAGLVVYDAFQGIGGRSASRQDQQKKDSKAELST
jgi:hypothetical protein